MTRRNSRRGSDDSCKRVCKRVPLWLPGMPGGRELGVIIGAALGREGTEALRYISGGDSSMCKDGGGSEHRASCKHVYLLICPCLHMYLKSKFEEQENARYDPPMFLGVILKCLPCNISSFSSVQTRQLSQQPLSIIITHLTRCFSLFSQA